MKFSLTTSLALVTAINALPLTNILPQSILNLPMFNSIDDEHTNLDYLSELEGIVSNINDETLDEGKYKDLPLIETEKLQELINEKGLRTRAEKLYNISLNSVSEYGNPTRVIGSPGHWGTIRYIINELKKLKGYYKVSTQKFDAIDGKVNSFSLLIDGVEPRSLEPLSLTPATPDKKPVHGNLVLVEEFGCSLENFPEFTKNNIALIKRGNCAFGDKSINAGLSGALGAIIYDSDGPLHGTLGSPTGNEVATVSISEEDAKDYIDALLKDPTHVFETTLYVDAYVKNITTLNVIAESTYGDHDNVVSLGGHSDSVSAGPGINDDGSGSISLLEVAKHLTNFRINNGVTFAWWAAEEEGLLGSYHYANTLTPEQNSKIRLFMDYDMMASPNYEYQVYDANNEDHPNGSGDLKDLYIDWYTSHGLNHTLVPFDGRSDYVGFIDQGIPAGGIATGAEGVKTPDGKDKFGGEIGKWFDPCYHQLCDNLSNPSYEAWVINTKLIAHSVAVYANSFKNFPEREATVTTKSNDFKFRGSKLII